MGELELQAAEAAATRSRAAGQDIENQAAQRKLDQDKKMDAAMGRMADRMDKYTNTQQGDSGLQPEQLSGRSDAETAGGAEAPGLQPMNQPSADDVQHRVGFGLFQNHKSLFSSPDFLNETAQDFMKSGLPQGVQWLEHGYRANKENMIEATQRANAGDLPGAEKAFNSTGDHKVQPGSLRWKDDSKTTLMGKNEDGSDFEMNPKDMMKSFLSPKEYFEQATKQQEAQAKTDEAKGMGEYRSAVADYYRGAKSALDRAKADKLGTVDPKTLNTVIQKGGLAMRKQLESEQSKEDSKFNVNGMTTLLPDMQAELGTAIRNGDDPEVAYQTVYNRYKDRVSGLTDALGAISKTANDRWGDDRKNQTMQDELQKLISNYDITPEEIKKFLPATKVGKADSDRIRAVLGKMKATGNVNAAPAASKTPTASAKKDYTSLWTK